MTYANAFIVYGPAPLSCVLTRKADSSDESDEGEARPSTIRVSLPGWYSNHSPIPAPQVAYARDWAVNTATPTPGTKLPLAAEPSGGLALVSGGEHCITATSDGCSAAFADSSSSRACCKPPGPCPSLLLSAWVWDQMNTWLRCRTLLTTSTRAPSFGLFCSKSLLSGNSQSEPLETHRGASPGCRSESPCGSSAAIASSSGPLIPLRLEL